MRAPAAAEPQIRSPPIEEKDARPAARSLARFGSTGRGAQFAVGTRCGVALLPAIADREKAAARELGEGGLMATAPAIPSSD